jgi:hypothetical protein
LITLDSQTLNSLSIDYLQDCDNEGAEPFTYIFKLSELEPSTRRDTKKKLEVAVKNTYDRLDKLEEADNELSEEAHELLARKWIKEFCASAHFSQLGTYQQVQLLRLLLSFMV